MTKTSDLLAFEMATVLDDVQTRNFGIICATLLQFKNWTHSEILLLSMQLNLGHTCYDKYKSFVSKSTVVYLIDVLKETIPCDLDFVHKQTKDISVRKGNDFKEISKTFNNIVV